MATITWNNTAGGSWGTGANWKGGVAPGATDTAVINGTGTYTVTVNAAYAAKYVNFDDANATLWMRGGNFSLGSKLTLTAGTLRLDGTYGTAILSGGTLDLVGGVLDCTGGELNGVTVEGPLTINNPNPSSALLIGASGLTAVGAGGVGNGVINVTGSNSHLEFIAGGSLNNATVNLGAPSYGAYVQATGSLTLGAGLTVDQKYAQGTLQATTTLTNDGTITATSATNYNNWIRMDAAYVLNAGVASVATDQLFLSGASVANKGTISATSGGTVVFGGSVADTFTNTGGVTLSSATADLSCTLTTASLNKFKNTSGAIIIGGYGSGYLVNSGATLSVGTATNLGLVTLTANGTIDGGSINLSTGQPVWNGGEINGVTLDGPLNLTASPNHAYLRVGSGGLTLTGAGGSGAGAATITGYVADLYLLASQTLTNTAVTIGDSFYPAIVTVSAALLKDKASLVLGSTASVTFVNNRGSLVAGASLTNAGTIDDTGSASGFAGVPGFGLVATYLLNTGLIEEPTAKVPLILDAATIVNKGTITASNSGTVVFGYGAVDSFTNSGVVSITNATAELACTLTTATLDTFKNSSGTIRVGIGPTPGFAGSYTGILVNTGATLSVGSGAPLGQVALMGGGTITGGVISQIGSGLAVYGGELNGVTVDGTLNLTGGRYRLNIGTAGLTLTGAGGAGPGALNFTGYESEIYGYGSQTFSNSTIAIGAANGRDNLLVQSTLTLGAGEVVNQVGLRAEMGGLTEMVNNGTISATGASSYAYFALGFAAGATGASFVNNGVIDVTGNDHLNIEARTNTNAGTISASAGATVVLGGTTFINTGLVSITNATVSVNDTITNATLVGFKDSNASVVITFGEVVNTGGTLALGTGTAIGLVTLQRAGTITGGTIIPTGQGVLFHGGYLDGVTFEGPVNLSEGTYGDQLHIGPGGLTVTGAGGVGHGTINLTGVNPSLALDYDGTLNNAVINMGVGGGYASIFGAYNYSSNMTLGSGLVINHNSYGARITGVNTVINNGVINATATSTLGGSTFFDIYGGYFHNNDVINLGGSDHLELRSSTNVNSGTININGVTLNVYSPNLVSSGLISGEGTISAATITNSGTIVASGGTLNLGGDSIPEFAAGTLTGGTWQADAASVLQLPNNDAITTDKTTVILAGAGSVIESLNTLTSTETTIESSLTSIAAAGALLVVNNRNWTSTSTITNSGKLILGGGTFATTSLINTGTVSGSGALTAAVSGAGTLIASVGTLSLGGAAFADLVAGKLTSGALIADAGATLELPNNAPLSVLGSLAELSGIGSQIQSLNTVGKNQVTLEDSLTSITSTGVLEVLGGRNFVAANAIGNAGKIQLGGGTFSGGALSDLAGSTLTGFGTVASSFTDAGAVTSSSGGALTFSGTGDVFTDALSGTEIDFAGGTQAINAGASVTATTWSLSGAATTLNTSLTFAGTLSEAATSTLTISTGDTLTLSGTAALAGTVAGSGTLADAKSVTLAGGQLSGGTLTVGSAATLKGDGQVSSLLTVVAGGLLDANVSAATLTLNATGLTDLNQGTVEATNGGVLMITGGTLNSLTGTISAGAGSFVTLAAGAVVESGATDVLATGGLTIANSSTLQVQGVTANAGVIDVASTGSQTDLRILQAGATLTGGGTIVLSGAKDRILGFSATSTLTNVDNTIAGTCIFGAANLLTLVNESKGTIDATGVMTLDTSGSTVTNAGLMESTTGGLLTVSATTINQSGGGTLNAAGGMINFTGADIIGGTIASTTGFAVRVLTGANMLDGTTSAVNLTGTLQVLSTDTLTIVGTINNTGKLNPYGGTLMIGAGGAVLTGAGQVNLTANAANDITSTAAGATLTNAGNAIFGSGTIGGGTLTLVNQAAGVISNGLSVALTINTGSNTVINAGAIAATAAGGGVSVQSAVNNTGRLIANAGGTLTMNGAVTGAGIGQINGGELIIAQAFAENVFFLGKGVLELEDSTAYTGKIVGLSNAGTNSLDLTDITFTSGVTKATYSGTTASGTLTVTDGTHTANIKLIGNYTTAGAFVLSSDGHGGTTIVDPTPSTPAVLTQAMASFQIGAAANPAGPSPGSATNLPLLAAHG